MKDVKFILYDGKQDEYKPAFFQKCLIYADTDWFVRDYTPDRDLFFAIPSASFICYRKDCLWYPLPRNIGSDEEK